MRCFVLVLISLGACADGQHLDGAIGPVGGAPARVAEAECEVTSSGSQKDAKSTTNVWTYDPQKRRLVTTGHEYDIDEAGRTLRIYGYPDPSPLLTLYRTNHYDEHGNIESYEHFTQGVVNFVNTYEGDRLMSVEYPWWNGTPTKATYRYDDPSAPNNWTRIETDVAVDGPIDNMIERTIKDGRTETGKTFEQGRAHYVFTHKYSGDRIDTIDRDGGAITTPDGETDVRWQWKRDATGNVIETSEDRTSETAGYPPLDGVPDATTTFSTGCAPILRQFPWLASEPDPNSVGPRYQENP